MPSSDFWPDFSQRTHQEELMDLPSTTEKDHERALSEIRWVNQRLGGARALLLAMDSLIGRTTQKAFTVLDIGTGSADIPRDLVVWGQREKIAYEITAIDNHPVAVQSAHSETLHFPQIHIAQEDAMHLPYHDGAFDIVMSSMFMHHLEDAEAIHLLKEMARICRLGFIINDLERHPVAYWSIKILGWLTGKGAIFRHDAPMSVLRGFSVKELEAFKHQADLPHLEIQRVFPYRLILFYQKALIEEA